MKQTHTIRAQITTLRTHQRPESNSPPLRTALHPLLDSMVRRQVDSYYSVWVYRFWGLPPRLCLFRNGRLSGGVAPDQALGSLPSVALSS